MKMAGHSNRVRCGFHSHHPTTKGTTHGRSQTNMPRMRSSRCRTHRLNTESRGEQGRRPVVQHCLLRSMRPRVWRVCEDRESASTTASSVSGLDKSEMNFSRSSRREKYRSRNLSIKKSISFISSHLRFWAVFGVDRRIVIDASHRYRAARDGHDLSGFNCPRKILATAPAGNRAFFNFEEFGAPLVAMLFDVIG